MTHPHGVPTWRSVARWGRRVLGGCLIVSSLILLGVVWVFGANVSGFRPPDTQCFQSQDRPERGGPFLENTVIRGQAAHFPPGVLCTFDSPDDRVGPQQIRLVNNVGLLVGLLGVGGVATGIGLTIASRGRRDSL